jgi:lysophospholipase L1-like esterase
LLGEFVPNGTSLFVDEAKGIKPGTIVYYKVEAVEGSKVLALTPSGLSPLKTSAALSAAATVPYPPLNVVFIGDSITEGGWINKPDMNACEACAHALELGPKARLVFFSNQGHSGHTTKDYLPEWEDFTNAEAAAKKLEAEAPGELVFSVMLGTNDSANDGPNGSPANVDQYETNLKSTISALLHDFPQCKVVVHRPIWYSSNTHNGANYEETGLERLTTYFPVVERLAKAFPKGKVFVGDERGYSYFAEAYRGTLRVEHGRNGTFYLHPDPKGALDLGQLWANAILRAVG